MIDTADVSSRLEYLEFSDSCARDLREVADVVLASLPSILDGLYRHFEKHERASSFFGSKQIQEHAKQKQLDHWRQILEGSFEEDYRNSVVKIGEVHARIDLPLDLYMGSYSFMLDRFNSVLAEVCFKKNNRKEVEKFLRFSSAVSKAALMDMELTVTIIERVRKQILTEERKSVAENFERTILSFVDNVAQSAGALEKSAASMGEVASSTSEQAVSVSAISEQTSANVASVASAAEEMGAAIKEVASQVSHASDIAANAVETAEATAGTINTLSNAAQKVGDVVSLISDIAEQTNLLALNATIESARAGEAGRGFAVVASEVKILAGQTAKATDDIREQIGEMLRNTNQSVDEMTNIKGRIDEINSTSLSINAAVEEQSSSTQEIVRNTREAAIGTKDVSHHITSVMQGASRTGEESSSVVKATSDLGQQATALREEVEIFLGKLKAA